MISEVLLVGDKDWQFVQQSICTQWNTVLVALLQEDHLKSDSLIPQTYKIISSAVLLYSQDKNNLRQRASSILQAWRIHLTWILIAGELFMLS